MIPDSVEFIGGSAFVGCRKLVEVINHSSLDIRVGSSDYGYVAYYAKEVHTGESKIDRVGDYLFYTYENVHFLLGYVGSDTELTLPDSYKGESYEIYQWAFSFCYDLTSVVISGDVTSIGDSAFRSCTGLTSIKYRGTEEQWNAIAKGESWDQFTGDYTITYEYDGE